MRPEHGDARGRGSSRLFSARNLLQLALALHLRQLQIPVSVLAAVAYALTAFEEVVRRTEEPGFRLPESLRREHSAPDLRIVIGDGRLLYLLFDWGRGTPTLFGRVDLQPLRTDRLALEDLRQGSQFMERLDVFSQERADFGGPEGSRYWRLEVGVTRVARTLRLDL